MDDAIEGFIKHLRRNRELLEREEEIFNVDPQRLYKPQSEVEKAKKQVKKKKPKADDKERWEWRSVEECGWPKSGSEVEFYMPHEDKSKSWVVPCRYESANNDDIKTFILAKTEGEIYWRYLDLPEREMATFTLDPMVAKILTIARNARKIFPETKGATA